MINIPTTELFPDKGFSEDPSSPWSKGKDFEVRMINHKIYVWCSKCGREGRWNSSESSNKSTRRAHDRNHHNQFVQQPNANMPKTNSTQKLVVKARFLEMSTNTLESNSQLTQYDKSTTRPSKLRNKRKPTGNFPKKKQTIKSNGKTKNISKVSGSGGKKKNEEDNSTTPKGDETIKIKGKEMTFLQASKDKGIAKWALGKDEEGAVGGPLKRLIQYIKQTKNQSNVKKATKSKKANGGKRKSSEESEVVDLLSDTSSDESEASPVAKKPKANTTMVSTAGEKKKGGTSGRGNNTSVKRKHVTFAEPTNDDESSSSESEFDAVPQQNVGKRARVPRNNRGKIEFFAPRYDENELGSDDECFNAKY